MLYEVITLGQQRPAVSRGADGLHLRRRDTDVRQPGPEGHRAGRGAARPAGSYNFV